MQTALGGKPKVYEGDHLKGDHSTEWQPAVGGSIRVYEHMVNITLYSHFETKKMPRAEWTKLLVAMDGCGR